MAKQREMTFVVPGRESGRKSGFTLIELLVVIAIIGILAAILLPVLAGAKYEAKNTQCKSNLRQIDLAISLYTTDSGAFPLCTNEESEGILSGWFDVLGLPSVYVGVSLPQLGPTATNLPRHAGVFACPLNDDGPIVLWGVGNADVIMQAPCPWIECYGYNAGGVAADFAGTALGLGGRSPVPLEPPSYVPTRSTQVRAPAGMIALGDHFDRSPNASLDGVMDPRPLIYPDANTEINLFSGVYKLPPKKQPPFLAHHGRANRAFVDGHLEPEDMRAPYKATDVELRRWNLDNKPHREYLGD
ncbi:MAG: type II secretion system protein [Limisphaerales bacterium]